MNIFLFLNDLTDIIGLLYQIKKLLQIIIINKLRHIGVHMHKSINISNNNKDYMNNFLKEWSDTFKLKANKKQKPFGEKKLSKFYLNLNSNILN